LISAYHAKYYAHELTRRHVASRVDRLSPSMVDASVDLNPHHIEAALFALRNLLQEGVLFADTARRRRSFNTTRGRRCASVF
jgi:hypothetical protein